MRSDKMYGNDKVASAEAKPTQPPHGTQAKESVSVRIGEFAREQRTHRKTEYAPGSTREGLHVTIGHEKPLAPNFVPSHASE